MLLSASATVSGKPVDMKASGESVNAIVPLTVINTRGPELPRTGDNGVWMYGVIGGGMMLLALAVIILASRSRKKAEQ